MNAKLRYGGTIIDQMKKAGKLASISQNNLEFEIRLGKIKDGVFNSGVSRDFFQEVLDLVMKQAGPDGPYNIVNPEYKDKWEESWTLYFAKQIRCHQSTAVKGLNQEQQFEQNGNITRQDFKSSSSSGQYDLRFALKKEIPLTREEAYKILETDQPKPTSIRLRQRRTFLIPKYHMKLDFTVAYLAKSISTLMTLSSAANNITDELLFSDKKQVQGVTKSFEIELEAIVGEQSLESAKVFQCGVKLLGFGFSGVLLLEPV